ncbi:acetate--CoA ligase [Gluconacetobacter azotocaptans]|uniref:Acetate--CoA ligase n=1 Tax=Gluconacetobacter azotocaptans TaxID=142834 RepID=A0A7W4PCF8_9PROT|nr:acetate--CoA ligase [Gluconacetobacter azotocaptans]MBB2188653.1 acetate--CoA ligase [Gluconacetobacter azotocaptans]GBQ35215.1 acetyl-CoA synthetase [Gluconacetobacter azotocaptans DSM 13594]
MTESSIFPAPPSFAAQAAVDSACLRQMRDDALHHPERFWLEQAGRIAWAALPTIASSSSFEGDVAIRWFEDGRLNASVTCLDRHLAERGDQVALVWQGQDEGQVERLTYRALHERVCRMANVLRDLGVGHGDRVAIHLPVVVEGVVAMLACARIGAVHVVLFGGFSAEGLADRLVNSGAVVVLTADEGRRGGKRIPLKPTMDEALDRATGHSVRNVLVLAVTGAETPMHAGRDLALAPLLAAAPADCAPAIMEAEAPLFVLYTSGSTGKPKGMVHTIGGYMVWASYTHALVFDHKPGDIFWCTADISWITGHTYVVYGPLANGGTVVLFEGLPSHPAPGRWWEVIDTHKVTTFYTAPTAIRALMREGDDVVARYPLSSLRLLGSVGEPISADAWLWFHDVVGRGRCPLVDTWWQTETGGILIAPVPAAVPQKPGSATLPLPGVDCVLLDDKGRIVTGEGEGCLCIARSWPGQARTIWGDHARFRQTYFSFHEGYYFSSDGARRDADGYYWITGRIDDVINVSGHRIGTAEVEDVVATDHRFAECAAVGVPHDLKGQGLVVFVVPRGGVDRVLAQEAALVISRGIGRYAAPEQVYVVPDLPKTRSGKIVRRLLRKIACNELDALGDLSTLADATIVERLIVDVAGQG